MAGIMSTLEEARKDFWDAWNGLSQVHIQEELEAQSKKMWTTRKRLWKLDPEFRATMKSREEDGEKRKRRMQISQQATKDEASVSAARIRADARRMAEGNPDEWVKSHRFKIRTPEEAETKGKLVCPICLEPDRGNILNEEPTCMRCMHITVPEDKLKDYPRKYRRAWKKK